MDAYDTYPSMKGINLYQERQPLNPNIKGYKCTALEKEE
jgi:hypothetical protein